MRPYGFVPGDWKGEDGGPTSRFAKLTSKNRRECRRILAKKARGKNRRELLRERQELCFN